MAIKTRLDKRSEGNQELVIVDSESNEIIAKISAVSNKVELEITTIESLHIEKPNGYSSKR